MPIDSKTVGSNERQVVIVGDPTTASQYGSVVSIADAATFAGLYAQLASQLSMLYNGTTYDRMRSQIGTTGILAVDNEGTKVTYSVGTTGFTPAATATDFFTLLGSGTKTVRARRIVLTGISSAVASVAISLIKRSTANSSGTSAALTIAPNDSNDAAATAVVNTWSVNPTLGTPVGTVRAEYLNLPATGGGSNKIIWDFSNTNDKAVVLRGATQQLCCNWGGAAVPGGTSLTMWVEWTEE